MARLQLRSVLCACLFVIIGVLLFAADACAQRELRIAVSSAQIVNFRAPARSVFIADPAIADVQVASPESAIVFGRKPGQTTLIAIGENDKPLANMQVVVNHSYADLRRLILQDTTAPEVKITSTPSGISLSGTVATNEIAEKVTAAAQRYAGEKDVIVNNIQVAGPAQVNLRVRVAEVSRSLTKQLGFNWEAVVNPGSFMFGLATGRPLIGALGSRGVAGLLGRAPTQTGVSTIPNAGLLGVGTSRISINNVIDALAEEGLVTILAQPNLTAISGQTASFLAGGEFPVPVAQNNAGTNNPTITVEFKPFGVRLDFVPTVLSTDRIAIRVRPEVSQLSTQGRDQGRRSGDTGAQRAPRGDDDPPRQRRELRHSRPDPGQHQHGHQQIPRTGRSAGHRPAVPLLALSTHRNRAGYHRHPVCCSAGAGGAKPQSADRRSAAGIGLRAICAGSSGKAIGRNPGSRRHRRRAAARRCRVHLRMSEQQR